MCNWSMSKRKKQIWALRFDDQANNIFQLQDQVLKKILSGLTLELSAADQGRITRGKTTNLEAYDYYQRAERRRHTRSGEAARGRVTLELYQKSINLDPGFAAAYAGLAREALENWQLDASQVMPAATSRKLAYEVGQQGAATGFGKSGGLRHSRPDTGHLGCP